MSSSQITLRGIICILFVTLLLPACLPSNVAPTPSTSGAYSRTRDEQPRPDTSDDGGWIDWDGKDGWTSHNRRAMSEAGEEVVVEKELATEVSAAPAIAGADAPMANPSPLPTAVAIQDQSPLRAGEVDDNAEWDDYLLYRLSYVGFPCMNESPFTTVALLLRHRRYRPKVGAQSCINYTTT